MIRVAFDVNHLRRDVLSPIADRVNEDAASHRAIRTRRTRFGGACNLQLLKLGVSRLEVEPEYSGADCAESCKPEEVSPSGRHRSISASGQESYPVIESVCKVIA